jgi:hypothetical protein
VLILVVDGSDQVGWLKSLNMSARNSRYCSRQMGNFFEKESLRRQYPGPWGWFDRPPEISNGICFAGRIHHYGLHLLPKQRKYRHRCQTQQYRPSALSLRLVTVGVIRSTFFNVSCRHRHDHPRARSRSKRNNIPSSFFRSNALGFWDLLKSNITEHAGLHFCRVVRAKCQSDIDGIGEFQGVTPSCLSG